MTSFSKAGCLTVLAFMVALAQVASAAFECEKQWTGPDADNSILECVMGNAPPDGTLYLGRIYRVISFAVPFLFILWCLCCYPVAFCARQCAPSVCKCCGSNRRRPESFCGCGTDFDDWSAELKEAEYSYGEVQRTKSATGILWLLGMVCLVLIVLGASMMGEFYDGFWAELDGLADWTEAQVGNIRSTLTVNGTLMDTIPETAFTSALNETAKLRNRFVGYQEDLQPTMEYVYIVAFTVGVVPVVLLVIGNLFAVCDIRTCGPATLTCCYALFIIIYGVIALIFLVLAMLTSDVCDEIDNYFDGKVGVIAWYVDPFCNNSIDLDQIKQDVANAETTNSISGCEQLFDICNSNASWDIAFPRKVYVCTMTNATTDCTTFASFNDQYANAYPKAGQPALCDGLDNSQCNAAACATSCKDASTKSGTVEVIKYLDFAKRALDSFNLYILPLVKCSSLITQALKTFTECRSLSKSILLIGCGATCYSFIFCLGICNMMRGQKRFFKKVNPELGEESEDGFDNLADDVAAESGGNTPGGTTPGGGKRKSRRYSNSPGGSPGSVEPHGRPKSPGGKQKAPPGQRPRSTGSSPSNGANSSQGRKSPASRPKSPAAHQEMK